MNICVCIADHFAVSTNSPNYTPVKCIKVYLCNHKEGRGAFRVFGSPPHKPELGYLSVVVRDDGKCPQVAAVWFNFVELSGRRLPLKKKLFKKRKKRKKLFIWLYAGSSCPDRE